MKKILFLIAILFCLVATPAYAHPGRLDARGGHTCRTNCEEWGLKTGEWHSHNGVVPTKTAKVQTKTLSKGGEIQTIETNVISVVDGDTLKVEGLGKVRLIGVDTPETVDPRKPVQCFGKEASAKTRELLTGKKVRLEGDATQGDRDKFGRALRYVYFDGDILFNKLLISEGFAHEYTYNLPYKFMDDFKAAEREARDANRGLWNPDTCP